MTPRARLLLALLVTLVIYAAMDSAIRATDPWHEPGAGAGTSEEQLAATVDRLFDDHVVAFEVLGILLTAAMIGALVIARPLTGPADSTHYPEIPAEQVAESQRQSDVATHFGGRR